MLADPQQVYQVEPPAKARCPCLTLQITNDRPLRALTGFSVLYPIWRITAYGTDNN